MKKNIAICMTRVNEEAGRNFVGTLRELLDPTEYTIAVFHSVHDFSGYHLEDGAKAVYKMIPYSMFSVVIILHDSLYEPSIIDGIVKRAEKANVPVIMARGLDERCYSITADFREAYKKLINSVIKEQGITDTFYIAGRAANDPDSEQRLAVYKEVLEENGLVYDKNRVEYGEYWETPTIEAVGRIFEKYERFPEALFCANDIMAVTAVELITDRGLRVPEDVMVVGFDGMESAKYSTPSISTCSEDTSALVRIAADMIVKLCAGEEVPRECHYPFRASIRQSTVRDREIIPDDLDTRLFFRMRMDEVNERDYNTWLDSVIAVPNVVNLRSNIPAITMNGCSVSIRAGAFLNDDSEMIADFPSEYIMLRRNDRDEMVEKFVLAEKLVAKYLEKTPEGYVGYYAMISNHGFVYGMGFMPVKDIQLESQKAHRFIGTVDRALFIALSGERQRKTIGEHYKKKYIDAMTGMLNIDGVTKWYADNVLSDYTHTNNISVGVYAFVNYQQVLEAHGTHNLENNMQQIAKSLKLSNPDYAVIARISVDSFAVILLHPYSETYAYVIDNAISLFYGYLETQKKNEPGAADIEISCGYTDSATPWQSKLSDFINAATSNLYRNRVSFERHRPGDIDMNDTAKLMEHRAMFMTLMNKNLFSYHFQPIVDAKTGEIVAYEALMRTSGDIHMSPLDVLAAATMYTKLEQLEYMTFVNIFERLMNDEKFEGKSVFINTIPGHFVRSEYCKTLFMSYSDLIKRSVIEITEGETITLDELEAIRTFGGCSNGDLRIAVDDYGTGHSNIVNLIEYRPQIVKIDRYLITNIDTDKNKQMFVGNLIEFATENNIKVLAEGVETKAELQTVIMFGVDYIQGYYTARPAPELLTELPENIKQDIIDAQTNIFIDL